MDAVRQATKELFRRYIEAMDHEVFKVPDERIVALCEQAIKNIEVYPIDKLSRWLGFVQGVLYKENIIDVDIERDFSRPLFHDAYMRENLGIPETYDYKANRSSKKD
jgi:hypothetical protein